MLSPGIGFRNILEEVYFVEKKVLAACRGSTLSQKPRGRKEFRAYLRLSKGLAVLEKSHI